MRRTIVVANQKGGSGKTTTAVNLAAALSERGSSVLLIDLDPQRSASRWLGFQDRNGGSPNVIDVLASSGTLLDCVHPSNIPGTDLVPSARKLVQLEKELTSHPVPSLALKNAMERLDRWDFVIIDTPPDLRLITVSALLACSEVLVAVQLSNQDIEGLSDLMETVALVVKAGNANLRIIGILPCRVNMRTRDAKEIHASLVKHFGDLVCPTMIRDTVKLRECQAYRRPITAHDPSGGGASDYRMLAQRILEGRNDG